MSKLKKTVVGVIGIACVINIFLFHSFGTTGMVIFLYLVLLYLLGLYVHPKMSRSIGIVSLVPIVYGYLIISRASGIVQALLLLGIVGSLSLLTYLLVTGKSFIHSVGELFFIPLHLVGSYLVAALETVAKTIGLIAHTHTKSKIVKTHGWQIALGILVAVPILLVLIGLLSTADPIFHATVGRLFQFTWPAWNDFFTRVVVTGMISCFLIPLAILRIRASDASPLSGLTKKNAAIPVMIIMGSVSLLLALFLLIQWPYVFAHVTQEMDLSKFGVATYSEYVKRGFTEFLMVAVILYSLLWMGLTAYRSHQGKEGKILLWIQTISVGLFFIFNISVIRRVLLYWDFHGLSLIRVYGGLFLVLVMALTTTLYLRHFLKFRFIRWELAGITAFLLFLGLWNQDAFILNNHPPTVNGQIDYVYLSRLSADGVDGWIKSYQFAANILSRNDLYDSSIVPLQSAQNRRDVAYAGYILSTITHRYDELMLRYGTEEEKRNYQRAITQWHIQALDESLTFLQTKPSSFHVYGGETGMRFEPLVDYEVAFTDTKNRLSGDLRSSSQTKQISFIPRSTWSLVQFDRGTCTGWSSKYSKANCVPSFYELSEQPFTPTQGILDRVFVWNASEYSAYQKLKTEIPIETLLAVQTEYTVLWKHILLLSQLGPGNMSYSLDISVDTPLLEAIE